MPITSITPKVDLTDRLQGFFHVYIGNHGIPINIQDFRKQVTDIIKGRNNHEYSSEHIIRNIAIFVAMNAVDINDVNTLKAAIESGSFKI